MRTFAEKSKATTPKNPSARSTTPGRGQFGHGHGMNSLLRLQRTIGNQATQRLLQGPAEDVTEDAKSVQSDSFGHDPGRLPSDTGSAAAPRTEILSTTKEGPETLESAASQSLDGASTIGTTTAAPFCSEGGVMGSFTNIPNGVTLAATLSGSKLGASFDMEAEFTPVAVDGSSAGGEYRQYVRGEFTSNGSTVTHPLCGSNLSPTVYQEDCANVGGTVYKYGYRSIRFANSYFDNPDQATGSTFHGWDYPGITGSSGDRLTVNLDFRGELVDICSNDTVLQTAEWSVAGTATVP